MIHGKCVNTAGLMDLIHLYSVSSEYKQPKSFSWERYLEETGTQAAPARAFKPVQVLHTQKRVKPTIVMWKKSCDVFVLQRPPHGFQMGMKVEAVDKRNPMLIRVVTIADTEDHRLKVEDVSSSTTTFSQLGSNPDLPPDSF